MIHFAIPLRAKKTAKNWEDVCRQLELTIKSIDEMGVEYRIVIACHDIPEISALQHNKRIVFVSAPFPEPADKNGYMIDKSSKKNMARRTILQTAESGDFFMFMDADDLVSKDFFHQINSTFERNPDVDDIVFHTGFLFDAGRKKLSYLDGKNKIFYKACGSCFISKLRGSDVDKNIDENDSFLFSLKDHTKFPESSITFGRSIISMRTPVVCYIMNHGSNDTSERVSNNYIESFVDSLICHDNDLIIRYKNNFCCSLA